MSTNGELACAYAVMVLHDEGIPVTAEKIATLLKVANVSTESYWPSLFAKLAQKRDIEDLILNAGSRGPAAPVVSDAAAPSGSAAAPPEDEKKKENTKDESDGEMDDGMFDLFAD